MNKEELIKHLEEKENITVKELKHLIHGLSATVIPPEKLKKGDVITIYQGPKKRPCVITNVFKDIVYVIPLSTTKDSLNLMEYHSRIYGNGYFTKSITSIPVDVTLINFSGVFDNNVLLNKAIKEIKSLIVNM